MLYNIRYRESQTGIFQCPTGNQGYLLVLFYQAVLVRVHGVIQEFPSGSVMIWSPGEAHYFGLPRTKWEYTGLEYRGATLRELLNSLNIPCNRLLQCSDPTALDEIFRCLHREFSHPQANASLLEHLFQASLLVLHRLVQNREKLSTDTAVEHAIKSYLDQHYTETISLTDIATHFGVSAPYLSLLFKKAYGIPAIKYITRLRMDTSKRLLQHPSLTVAEVAHKVGYANPFYFTSLFHRYFGETPSTYRQRIEVIGNSAPQSSVLQESQFSGWRRVSIQNFHAGADLDPRWRIYSYFDRYHGETLQTSPEQLEIHGGQLRLHPSPFWAMLRWEDDIPEECLVDIVAHNPQTSDGLNLLISLSGDLCNGYRVCVIGHTLRLETVMHGPWEVLAQCVQSLDPHAASYHIVFWRVREELFLEVNGERYFSFYVPDAPYGPSHRRIAIGRFGESGATQISSLRVLASPSTLTQDPLEPGRVLFRNGYLLEAHQWFLEAMQEQTETRLQQEADYYAVLTIAEQAPEHEYGLRRIGYDATHAFQTQALHALALLYTAQRRFTAAVDTTIQLATQRATADISNGIASRLVDEMRLSTPEQQEELLALITRLPLKQLHLHMVPNLSLAPLSGMELQSLSCDNAGVTDLSPLRNMPLELLSCSGNTISDLSPLAGLPLHTLSCLNNRIDDLSPLRGMALTVLNCWENDITDLSPLSGMPLTYLTCGDNQLTDLAPLRGMPLESLDCAENQITDLSPLQGMALLKLSISNNRIHDLSPLRDIPLTELQCQYNPIKDFSPLIGQPLERLNIKGIPIDASNGDIIANLPIRNITCDFTPEMVDICRRNETLLSINCHRADHALAIGSSLSQLLSSFFHRKTDADPVLCDMLRAHAANIGERAYLCLPCCLSYQDANAFAHWLGARLPRPDTFAQLSGLHQYIADIAIRNTYMLFYLGYHLDREAPPLPYEPFPSYGRMVRHSSTYASNIRFAFIRVSESAEVPIHIAQDEGQEYVVLEWME